MKQKTGVLLLASGKTYGRYKNRLLYQCVSDCPCVIPYEIQWGFSKKAHDKYVSYSLHPNIPGQGVLEQVFGDVDDPVAWNEYQIYSRELVSQNKKKMLAITLKGGDGDKTSTIDKIFTIDGEGTEDFDDGYRITEMGEDTTCLSIYIVDVASWILNNPDLAKILSEGLPATMYLAHRRIPLFPQNWVDQHFSLREGGGRRFCVVLDVFISGAEGAIQSCRWRHSVEVVVEKNYRYYDETAEVRRFNEITLAVNGGKGVSTTAENVAFWMRHYCSEAGHELESRQIGMFLDQRPALRRADFLAQIEGAGVIIPSEYKFYGAFLGSGAYAQMTSPIRRWVDIYNQYCFLFSRPPPGVNVDLDRVNRLMKNIRKLQMDSHLLNRFCDCGNDHILNAIIIDETQKISKTGILKYKYTVYLEELKLISRLSTLEPLAKEEIRVRLFFFRDEHGLKQKIKLSVENPQFLGR